MNLETLSDQELLTLKDSLQRELTRLQSTRKNLNNTIKNITDDMRDYRLSHGIIVENPHDEPRA
jgi:uncharacterized protein YlxW (UPF0749 family)